MRRAAQSESGRLFGVLCLGVLLSLARPAPAQDIYGSVVGVVRDAQGGVLTGAVITLVNRDSGQRREVKTNQEGQFTFVNVLNGSYDVRAQLSGFREAVYTQVSVAAGQINRVEFSLELGTFAQAVEVVATAEVLQTDKADVRTELRATEITQLPLNRERNYQALINLVPGSLPGNTPNSETLLPQRSIDYTVNGQGAAQNATRTDGTNLQNAFLPIHQMYIPPAETIDSVSIVTGSMDAEQGGTSGASVSVTTKSGTNQFKGSVFEFYNSHKLNARPFFLGTGTPPNKLPITRHTTGGTLGGPILSNKLFFFGAFEGYYTDRTEAAFFSVPDDKLRNGDFSSAFNANGSLQVIFDPKSGTNGVGRTPFANNRIPPGLIHPIATRVLAYYPPPNTTGTGAGQLTRNYIKNQRSTTARSNYDAKINWNVSTKHFTWLKISHMDAQANDQHVFAVPRHPDAGGQVTFWQGTAGHTWMATPTLVVDGTLGVGNMYTEAKTADYFDGMIGLTLLGIPGTNDQGTGEERYSGLPGFITGFQNPGDAVGFIPNTRADRTTSGTVNLTRFAGAHEIKAGYTMSYMTLNHWNPEGANPRGAFTFASNATRTLGPGTQTANFYNQWAAFLMGYVGSISKSVQYRLFTVREWQHAAYIRDRWNVSPRLTVDAGLRWEYYPVMSRWDLGKGLERLDTQTLEVILGGVGGNPRNVGFQAQKTLFAPRVGAVYRLDEDRTVLRAGYGLSYNARPWAENFNGRGQYPLAINSSFLTPANQSNFGWYGMLDQGIPFIQGPDMSSGRVPLPNTVGMTSLGAGVDQRPRTHSWNVAVQRRLPIVTLDVAYVGSRSVDTYQNVNLNAVRTLGGGATDRPYLQQFGRQLAVTVRQAQGRSEYNSLQVGFSRPLRQGVLLKGHYTFSRAWTLGTSYELPEFADRNWTRQGGNRDHVLQVGFIYQVPWQTDMVQGLVKKVLADWQVSGTFGALSGSPFTVTADATALNTPGNTMTADLVGPLTRIGELGENGFYYDPEAFAQPACTLCLGNTRVNQFTGPGYWTLDMSFMRAFPLGGNRRIEFRVEGQNILNHAAYGNPSSSITSGTFMQVTGFVNTVSERLVRLAARFSF